MSRVHEALKRAAQESPQPNSASAGIPQEHTSLPESGSQAEQVLTMEERPRAARVSRSSKELAFRPFAHDSVGRNGSSRHFNKLGYEELLKLIQQVFIIPDKSAPRSVVFSSVDSNANGICFHAAQVLSSQMSGSVCVVDANLSAPSLHDFVGVGNSPGFADAIVEPQPIKDFAVPIPGGNLWLIPSGSPGLETANQFASDRFRARVDEMVDEFDCVLINAPQISVSPEAILLGRMSDGVILVVEAHSTRREMALAAKQRLEDAHIKLFGAILNNRTFPMPAALYRKL